MLQRITEGTVAVHLQLCKSQAVLKDLKAPPWPSDAASSDLGVSCICHREQWANTQQGINLASESCITV